MNKFQFIVFPDEGEENVINSLLSGIIIKFLHARIEILL